MYTPPKMKEKRRTDVGTELKVKAEDLKNWGDYVKACGNLQKASRDFPVSVPSPLSTAGITSIFGYLPMRPTNLN